MPEPSPLETAFRSRVPEILTQFPRSQGRWLAIHENPLGARWEAIANSLEAVEAEMHYFISFLSPSMQRAEPYVVGQICENPHPEAREYRR